MDTWLAEQKPERDLRYGTFQPTVHVKCDFGPLGRTAACDRRLRIGRRHNCESPCSNDYVYMTRVEFSNK